MPVPATPVFLAGLRTPFGTAHRGAFKDTRPDDLLVSLLKTHRERFAQSWTESVNDVVVGCAYPEGEQGYNIARTTALGAGLNCPGVTVNRLCASSLEAVAIAAAFVRSGRGQRFLVGGVESMSRVPRRGANFSESAAIAAASTRVYITMGETAEELALRHPAIDRAAQEELAAQSHERAHAAYAAGWYSDHVVPFVLNRDEGIRPVNREKMASLPPAFGKGGVVTAATSSPLSDGAACGLVLSEEEAVRCQAADGLRILDAAVSHVAPEVMGLGPVPAVRTILARNGLAWRDIAAVEINEAFAIQVLACERELDLDPAIVNSWGGALAIGHPLGASGLRLMMTLHGRLRHCDHPSALGLATLCIGGGQGMAVLCEYVRFGRLTPLA